MTQRPSTADSTSDALQAMRQKLEAAGGIRPSIVWLEQCWKHLQSLNGSSHDSDINEHVDTESIWDQILHSDLRYVVREVGHDNNPSLSLSSGPARVLRKAIGDSNRNLQVDANHDDCGASDKNITVDCGKRRRYTSSNKVTLPQDFKLLVQLEECLDATLNREQQLSTGTDFTHSHPNSGNDASGDSNNYNHQQSMHRNPKYRSFKMLLSDGYYSNGDCRMTGSDRNSSNDDSSSTDISASTTTFLAMETSPIQSLSIENSIPGVKLLLYGQIDVRFGILQLNDANTILIGGKVEKWKEVWLKAREKARKVRGLGIDPTIKALIWNPYTGDEDEADEGEGESSDVRASTSLPPVSVVHPPSQAPLPSISSVAIPIITPNHPANKSASTGTVSFSQSVKDNKLRTSNMRQSTLDYFSRRSFLDSSINANGSIVRKNPYQPQNSDNTIDVIGSEKDRQSLFSCYTRQSLPGTKTGTTTNCNLFPPSNNTHSFQSDFSRQQLQPQGSNVINPYTSLQYSKTQSNTTNCGGNGASNSIIHNKNSISNGEIDSSEKYSNKNPSTSSQETAASNNINVFPQFLTTNFESAESFSFLELKELLLKLRTNRPLYEECYGRTFIVPCKLKSDCPEKVFNIVKVDKSKCKKGEKKYEFLFVCPFFGPKASEGCIACRVNSSLMEEFFDGHTPGEIRKLRREEKDRINKLVNDSSTQFLHEFSFLAEMHLKLLLSPDDFFNIQMSTANEWLEDVQNPVLEVVFRQI